MVVGVLCPTCEQLMVVGVLCRTCVQLMVVGVLCPTCVVLCRTCVQLMVVGVLCPTCVQLVAQNNSRTNRESSLMSPWASANTLYNILTCICKYFQRHYTIRPGEKTTNVVLGRNILKTIRTLQCCKNTTIPFGDPNINLKESTNSIFQSVLN